MKGMRASLGPVRFRSICEALRESGVSYSTNDSSAVLVWFDSLKDIDYFHALQPYQIVNRIPSINVICRKASFTRIIQRISPFFPNLYSFYPKSFILPFKNAEFMKALSKNQKSYIVKPDNGSLGEGIAVIEPGTEYFPDDDSLAVAQEYIPSLLVDNTKFDLRIYALVASVNPLKVYVYRDGLARFCSEEANANTLYARLTNVTFNKENPELEEISEISRLISDTFPRLEKELGVNIDELWDKIDEAVVLSILAAYSFISRGEIWQCPRVGGYSRCFQILGFDILVGRNFKPYVLEVNYRPNLDYYRAEERRMKVGMIRDAIRIAAPLDSVQSAVLSQRWAWDREGWYSFIEGSPEIRKSIKDSREDALKEGKFVKVFPTKRPDRQIWYHVIEKVISLPTEIMPGFKYPQKLVKGGEA